MKQKMFADFDDAFAYFLSVNCAAVLQGGGEVGGYNPPFIDCEIRIALNFTGGGYIHLLGRDCETVDFLTMNHYKLTNTPKPKDLL